MIRLVPMTPEQYREYEERELPLYAADQARAGHWEPAAALELARKQVAELLPNGFETPGHYFRIVVDEASGRRVGETWFGIRKDGGRAEMFVFWIGIDEPHRGRGYGSRTLGAIEEEARRQGIDRIGLNVFAHNPRAHALYLRLGFAPVATLMGKTLGPRPSPGDPAVPSGRRDA